MKIGLFCNPKRYCNLWHCNEHEVDCFKITPNIYWLTYYFKLQDSYGNK